MDVARVNQTVRSPYMHDCEFLCNSFQNNSGLMRSNCRSMPDMKAKSRAAASAVLAGAWLPLQVQMGRLAFGTPSQGVASRLLKGERLLMHYKSTLLQSGSVLFRHGWHESPINTLACSTTVRPEGQRKPLYVDALKTPPDTAPAACYWRTGRHCPPS